MEFCHEFQIELQIFVHVIASYRSFEMVVLHASPKREKAKFTACTYKIILP